jgi:hypothetical protein
MKKVFRTLIAGQILAVSVAHAGPDIDYLHNLQQQGIQPDPAAGRQLWYAQQGDRSCISCHGSDPGGMGKHIKTGKAIEPMAVSVNPERYRKSHKIDKWFLRNCKWTLGRTCSDQEKADILSWLQRQ